MWFSWIFFFFLVGFIRSDVLFDVLEVCIFFFFFPDGFMVLFDLCFFIYYNLVASQNAFTKSTQPNNFPQNTLIFSSLSQFIKHPVAKKKIPEKGAVSWESVTRNWWRMTSRAPQWPLTLQPVLLPLKLELGTILPPERIWLWIRDPKLRTSYSWRWWWNSSGRRGGFNDGDGHQTPANNISNPKSAKLLIGVKKSFQYCV